MAHFSPLIKRERRQPWTMNSWKRDCANCTTQTIFIQLMNKSEPINNPDAEFPCKGVSQGPLSNLKLQQRILCAGGNVSIQTSVTPQDPNTTESPGLSKAIAGPSAQHPTTTPAQPAAFSCWGQHSAAGIRAWLWSMLSPPLPRGQKHPEMQPEPRTPW